MVLNVSQGTGDYLWYLTVQSVAGIYSRAPLPPCHPPPKMNVKLAVGNPLPPLSPPCQSDCEGLLCTLCRPPANLIVRDAPPPLPLVKLPPILPRNWQGRSVALTGTCCGCVRLHNTRWDRSGASVRPFYE